MPDRPILPVLPVRCVFRLAPKVGIEPTAGAASRVQIREVLNWDNVAIKFDAVYQDAVRSNIEGGRRETGE